MGLSSRCLPRKLGRASFPLHKDSSKEKLRHGLSLVEVCRCLRVKTRELTGRRGCSWGMGHCLVMAIAEQRRPRDAQGSCLPLQGSVRLWLPTVREEVAAQAKERATKRKTDALPAGQVGWG